MKRSVVVVIVLLAAVLGGAFLLYERLFAVPPVEIVRRVDAGPTVVEAPVAGEDAGPVIAVVDVATRVTALRGKVERRGPGGAWVAVKVGEQLAPDEAIRTGRNAEANLAVGDGVTVRLSPRSEFQVREITDRLSRVRLRKGHVTASVGTDGSRVLRVETPGSDAVAESAGGEFGVVTDGQGQLTVAATTGSVKLKAKGKIVDIGAGQTATARAGEAPSAPRDIPKSLFLKLAGAGGKARTTNQGFTNVEGTTDPGAVVKVGNTVARVGADGRFKVKVPLVEGPNSINVEVLDPMGRAKDVKLPDIELDQTDPAIDTGGVKWGG